MNYRHYIAAIASAALTATLTISPTGPAAAQTTRTITLESGTVIPVKLRDKLSSTDSHKGDRFTATLQSEEAARSLRIPLGSFIEGTVAAVRPMRGNEPGVIALNFDRVVLPNESSYPIHGSLIGLDSKSVTRENNGRLVAKPDQKNKTLMYAGYGAGAGLILGALTKGNTILDTLIGGGLGYLLGSLDKSHGAPRDVVLKPNTELGVRLDRPVSYKEYYNGTESSDPYVEPYRRDHDDRNDGPDRRNRDDRYDESDRRKRTDQYNDRTRTDRDQYRDRENESRTTREAGDYRVLSEYADVRNNGEPIRVVLNGRRHSFLSTERPFISGGAVMIAAIPVLKEYNDRYSITEDRFTVYGPDETFIGTVGSRFVTGSDGRRLTLPASIQRRYGIIYVPMQFLALVTGQSLSFDRETQTIELGSARTVIER